ncbi:undecaprenyldiphospho-muramoylpentapeptide beta-N-acetylglucosaminyltransferase [Cellulosilyticum sp. I15G10I2]|uniref:undecaprenyldiphospho-muramoylpentapeptide beta-N-acetylglucosaminyltransferase n=1 Tax=Cellulosilyticum sp. I15G10I2 TaxID=1892843 RepID=UPI001FA6B997|nr:undecaprenyldiphospho-muramoylpentapeptide beta-N-acetylglucosaminyltransferase [Cellulosilyticum sp. I15G10I2]
MFTCGGTGGHIYPAIALYEAFRKSHKHIDYLFVGSDYGLEKDIMKNEGIPIECIKSRGIKRSLSLSNIKSGICNFIAFFQAKKIISKFKPDLVISTGAYPTFHITYFATKKEIPVFLIESNSMPGFVTRLFSNKARKVFINSKITLNYLKNQSNIEVVGIPLRIVNSHKKIEQIFKEQNLNKEEKVVTVIGGSCGSKKINECLMDIINHRELNYQIIWATGKNNYSGIMEGLNKEHNKVKVMPYINNMSEILKITDLMICRAGAMTIEEIKAFAIPAILVPFAKATDNHQHINALELKNAGAAEILEEKNTDANMLYEKINKIITNDETLKVMKKNYELIKSNHSKEKIVEIIWDEMRRDGC